MINNNNNNQCVFVCMCVCVRARARVRASARVRLRAREHNLVGLDETTKEIKHLEAISTFSPVGLRSSDSMKMGACERERARERVRNKLEVN